MNPIMEDDQDQEQNKKKKNKQHVCKFCSKSFPCGRSLGGHMRSHVINASSSAEADHHEKLLLAASADSEAGYYGLRENPKKTWRLNSSEEEDTLFLDKFCKECGKGFPSWKSLFGHMKCHSEKERSVSNNNNKNTTNSFFDDQVQDSSWNTNTNDDDDDDSCTKLVFDSQSDSEATDNAPNRRKRSKRVRTRYMVAPPPPPSTNSSNVSEIEQDEVVAMSLIMLSRDVGNWGGINSVPDNNSNLLNFDAPSSVIEGKRKKNKVLVTNGSDFAAKLTNPKGDKSSEILSASTNHSKYTSIKAKFLDSEAEFSKISHQNKRGKFECTTCNKIFHSYQALGGHRASHKKIKGCFASRNYEGSENSIEFEELDPSSIITDPTTTAETSNNKHIMKKNSDNNNNELYHLEQHHEEEEEEEEEEVVVVIETESKNKGKGFHECPICLKVFTSGQALGGHKRSHMSNNGGSIEGGKKCQSQRVVLHESVPEIRDFLDLNLPADDAAAEEEVRNNSSHVDVNYRPWWVVGGGNHKQEALVGLISN